jgi:hypothetical protein
MRQGYIDSLVRLGLDPADFCIPEETPSNEWWRLLVWMLRTKPGEGELVIGPGYCFRAALRSRSGRFY